MQRIQEASPRAKARITGVVYALTITTGIFSQGFVTGRLIVSGDASTTATRHPYAQELIRVWFCRLRDRNGL